MKLKDIILCLDIDHTLVCSIFQNKKNKDVESFFEENEDTLSNYYSEYTLVDPKDDSVKGKGSTQKVYMIHRPGLNRFIKYITDNIGEIHIFSAGQHRYVCAASFHIFGETYWKEHPSKINSYSSCDFFEIENSDDIFTVKDLESKSYNLKNTLIIDDISDTFSRNPDNAIHIPKYNPELSTSDILSRKDDSLLKIIEWFKKIKDLEFDDIRDLDKTKIF